jgi:hypothetical protein
MGDLAGFDADGGGREKEVAEIEASTIEQYGQLQKMQKGRP